MNTHTLLYRMGVATLILTFGVIIVVLYWLIYPYEILTFGEGNGIISNTTVKGGEYLRMRQVSCKHKDGQSTINRQFIDSIVYQVPLSVNDRPLGCSDKEELIYVPKALPEGEYYLSTTISFKVNPIRTVSYVVKTNTFTIVGR